jgi:hypothetical protein
VTAFRCALSRTAASAAPLRFSRRCIATPQPLSATVGPAGDILFLYMGRARIAVGEIVVFNIAGRCVGTKALCSAVATAESAFAPGYDE